MPLVGGLIQPRGGGGGGAATTASQVTDSTFFTTEAVSGVKAVSFTQSGTLQVARAGVSGRMPSVGVVVDNLTSGQAATLYRGGQLYNSGFNFSGWADRPCYVGWSGDVVASGAPGNSGDIQQILGVTISQSGMMLQLGDPLEGVIAGSGDIGSGAITGQAGGGFFCIASGTLGTNDLGSGSITSGQTASGQLGSFHLGSGTQADFSQYSSPIVSGLTRPAALITGEVISGIRAICISQSGAIQVAMAAVSGRAPAVGVVVDNVLSGLQCNVLTGGVVFPSSGLFTGINNFGRPVWLGRSGHVIPLSGSFGSGGYASGDIGQKLGVALALGSGGFLLSVNSTVWSGGPLGEATGGGIV